MRFVPQPMVDWYDIERLAIVGVQTVLSSAFGNFADKREMQAALGQAQADEERFWDERGLRDGNGELWLDFISDTGDGFDSTYSVAYSAGREVELPDRTLPRGSLLLLGGDQVYPTPEMREYNARFRGPFTSAYPAREEAHTRLYAIPGNHDWYDGLTNFLRLFCQQRRFGDLQTYQRRSYFALRLTDNCWVWGIDNQLSGELDKPQKDYFREVAAQDMQDGDNLILLTAQPAWVEERRGYDGNYQTLSWFLYDYALNGRRKVDAERPKRFSLRLVLTGDLHHYSRYAPPDGQDGPHLITAGGGGAFTHTTHWLPAWCYDLSRIPFPASGAEQRDPDAVPPEPGPLLSEHGRSRLETLYPSRAESLALTRGNLRWGVLQGLPAARLSLPLLLAGLLLFFRMIFPQEFFQRIAFFYALTHIAGWRKWGGKRWPALVHGLVQAAWVGLTAWSYDQLGPQVVQATGLPAWIGAPLGWLPPAFLHSLLCGLTLGLYFRESHSRWGMHETDASSTLRSTRYKNFLRMRVGRDFIEVYPLGLDRSVEAWEDCAPGTDLPRYQPRHEGPRLRLIEEPIRIDLTRPLAFDGQVEPAPSQGPA